MQRVYVRGQYPDRDNKPKRRRDCAKNTQFGPISWRMRRLSKVTVMRRHSVAMAFLSDASETRPEAACRLSNRDSHPNTSFSSGRGWRGPCFARTVTTVTICCKLWLGCHVPNVHSLTSAPAFHSTASYYGRRDRAGARLEHGPGPVPNTHMILRNQLTAKPSNSTPIFPRTKARSALAPLTALCSRPPNATSLRSRAIPRPR